jgi:c-di-GMP-binding flagellar brake protein YcgR
MSLPSERRKFPRFEILNGLAEPVTVGFKISPAARKPASVPAVLTNLSAGGMSVVLFSRPPAARSLQMILSLPGLRKLPVEGRVVRSAAKGETYSLGIAFSKIAAKHRQLLEKMAEHNADCDTRIALRLPESCMAECAFHPLCNKPQKGPYWQR